MSHSLMEAIKMKNKASQLEVSRHIVTNVLRDRRHWSKKYGLMTVAELEQAQNLVVREYKYWSARLSLAKDAVGHTSNSLDEARSLKEAELNADRLKREYVWLKQQINYIETKGHVPQEPTVVTP